MPSESSGIPAREGSPKFTDRKRVVKPRLPCRSLPQPDTGEQALEIAEALVRSGAMDVVVVDSVAALVPRAEIEGEMGDSHMGLQARLMSQAQGGPSLQGCRVQHSLW
jgi:hypothetical protein